MVSNADASVATRLSHDLTILAGYRRAVAACGERERVLLAWLGVDDCRVGVRAMLDGPDPPRGFVLAGSLIVFEALGALVQAGRAVGREVRVAAIAGEERPRTALCWPAAADRGHDHEIGRRAGELLLRRLGGEVPPSPRTITVPMELVDELEPARNGHGGDACRHEEGTPP